MIWSLPEGFDVVPGSTGANVTVVVARQARAALLEAGIERPEEAVAGASVAGWVEGGRVRHAVIRTGQDLWLVKAYRRGGLMARWNADRYWSLGRFLRELRTAVAAARAGVPAPEPVALVVKGAGWAGYRVWQVVRYVPHVASLKGLLQPPGCFEGGAARGAIFRAAGEAVRKMHQAEIDHPDLNVGNILARAWPQAGGAASAGAEAFIVDWDKARLRPPGTWNPHRNLLRLWRSALKLTRLGSTPSFPDPAALRAFLRGYFGQNRSGLRALRDYVRPRRVFLFIHAALWQAVRLGKTP